MRRGSGRRSARSTSRRTDGRAAAAETNPVLALLGVRSPPAAPPSVDPARRRSREARRPRSACSRPRGSSASTSPLAARERAGAELPLRPDAAADVHGRRARGRDADVHAKGAPEEVLARATRDRRPRRPPCRSTERATASRCWRRSSATPTRGCACSRSRGGCCRRRRAAGAPRGGRARALPARARGALRPAAAGGGRGRRALPRGRHPDHRGHRRLRADRRRDRAPGRDRARRRARRHRRRSSTRMSEHELDALLATGDELIFARSRPRRSCGSPTRCGRRATSSR